MAVDMESVEKDRGAVYSFKLDSAFFDICGTKKHLLAVAVGGRRKRGHVSINGRLEGQMSKVVNMLTKSVKGRWNIE